MVIIFFWYPGIRQTTEFLYLLPKSPLKCWNSAPKSRALTMLHFFFSADIKLFFLFVLYTWAEAINFKNLQKNKFQVPHSKMSSHGACRKTTGRKGRISESRDGDSSTRKQNFKPQADRVSFRVQRWGLGCQKIEFKTTSKQGEFM